MTLFEPEPIVEYSGDTFSKTIEFTYDDDSPVDITGWTIYVTVKDELSDTDADAVLSDDITTHDSPTNGQTSFSFSSADTESLSDVYFFEVKYDDGSGEIETISRRRLSFKQSVRGSI